MGYCPHMKMTLLPLFLNQRVVPRWTQWASDNPPFHPTHQKSLFFDLLLGGSFFDKEIVNPHFDTKASRLPVRQRAREARQTSSSTTSLSSSTSYCPQNFPSQTTSLITASPQVNPILSSYSSSTRNSWRYSSPHSSPNSGNPRSSLTTRSQKTCQDFSSISPFPLRNTSSEKIPFRPCSSITSSFISLFDNKLRRRANSPPQFGCDHRFSLSSKISTAQKTKTVPPSISHSKHHFPQCGMEDVFKPLEMFVQSSQKVGNHFRSSRAALPFRHPAHISLPRGPSLYDRLFPPPSAVQETSSRTLRGSDFSNKLKLQMGRQNHFMGHYETQNSRRDNSAKIYLTDQCHPQSGGTLGHVSFKYPAGIYPSPQKTFRGTPKFSDTTDDSPAFYSNLFPTAVTLQHDNNSLLASSWPHNGHSRNSSRRLMARNARPNNSTFHPTPPYSSYPRGTMGQGRLGWSQQQHSNSGLLPRARHSCAHHFPQSSLNPS